MYYVVMIVKALYIIACTFLGMYLINKFVENYLLPQYPYTAKKKWSFDKNKWRFVATTEEEEEFQENYIEPSFYELRRSFKL